MLSYSEVEVFKPWELELFKRAQGLVAKVPDSFTGIRCHEIARAVGLILKLQVQDGKFGRVEHSWLWVSKWEWGTYPPSILDVYAVGKLPQVQLIDVSAMSTPHLKNYYPEEIRGDVDWKIVRRLVTCMIEK